jgi:hypothetical protein
MPNEKLPTNQAAQDNPHSPLLPVCRHHMRPETQSKRTKEASFVIITEDSILLKDKGEIVSATLKQTTKPTLGTATEGQFFVIADSKLDVTTKKISRALEEVEGSASPTCDWIRAFKEFMKEKGDHYDFVVMVPDIRYVDPDTRNTLSPTSMPPITTHHYDVFNDVLGIRSPQYRRRPLFNTRRLQGIAAFDPDQASLRAQRLHEIGHRWGAFVYFKRPSDQSLNASLLDPNESHWGAKFLKGGSCMGGEGRQWYEWEKNSDGSFRTRLFDPDSSHWGYCPLDLYLMGMFAPSEVPPFSYIENLQHAPVAENDDRYSGRPVELRVEDIIRANGPRQPHAAYSQRSFRLGCIVLTKDLDEGKKLAKKLEKYRVAVAEQFREATRSRGILDTYLYDSSYDGIYVKHHDGDAGIEPSQGVFWDSPDIWVRNAEDGHVHATHQDIRPDQDNWVYVRVRNNGWQQPSDKMTVNIFQTDPGTEFLYPQDWKWDDDHYIDSQPVDPVDGGKERLVKFKWKWEKIRRLSTGNTGSPSLLVEILPSHPTLTKLRYVWEDRRIAQKSIITLRQKRGARELSFPFSIGTHSQPKRSVRIRVRQKYGSHPEDVFLDLGGKEKWLVRLIKGDSLPTRGGEVTERSGCLYFVVKNGYEGADITLPLLESQQERLVLKLNCGKRPSARDLAFEITQLNEQNEVVGGLDLIVRNGKSDHIQR